MDNQVHVVRDHVTSVAPLCSTTNQNWCRIPPLQGRSQQNQSKFPYYVTHWTTTVPNRISRQFVDIG